MLDEQKEIDEILNELKNANKEEKNIAKHLLKIVEKTNNFTNKLIK